MRPGGGVLGRLRENWGRAWLGGEVGVQEEAVEGLRVGMWAKEHLSPKRHVPWAVVRTRQPCSEVE